MKYGRLLRQMLREMVSDTDLQDSLEGHFSAFKGILAKGITEVDPIISGLALDQEGEIGHFVVPANIVSGQKEASVYAAGRAVRKAIGTPLVAVHVNEAWMLNIPKGQLDAMSPAEREKALSTLPSESPYRQEVVIMAARTLDARVAIIAIPIWRPGADDLLAIDPRKEIIRSQSFEQDAEPDDEFDPRTSDAALLDIFFHGAMLTDKGAAEYEKERGFSIQINATMINEGEPFSPGAVQATYKSNVPGTLFSTN